MASDLSLTYKRDNTKRHSLKLERFILQYLFIHGTPIAIYSTRMVTSALQKKSRNDAKSHEYHVPSCLVFSMGAGRPTGNRADQLGHSSVGFHVIVQERFLASHTLTE